MCDIYLAAAAAIAISRISKQQRVYPANVYVS